MKAKKLLKRLSKFLDADEKTQYQKIKSTKKVLKALKRKEASLKEQLQQTHENEAEAEAIQVKLDVIYAQRKKGVERVKQLRESKRPSESDSKDQ